MAKLLYFFSFVLAVSLGAYTVYAEGTEAGSVDEEVEAAHDEAQGTIDEQQRTVEEHVDAAEDTTKGQAGPDDAMDAVDEAKSPTAY